MILRRGGGVTLGLIENFSAFGSPNCQEKLDTEGSVMQTSSCAEGIKALARHGPIRTEARCMATKFSSILSLFFLCPPLAPHITSESH